jgi:alanyl-tRNA synthetase
MKNSTRSYITEQYKSYCENWKIKFQLDNNIKSYDDTTFFCPAGMQQFKSKFKDLEYNGTISNIQSCLRLNDIEEIGDGSHLLYFNMIGFFSFREWTVPQTINYWMGFLNQIGIKPDYITIHPDKPEWSEYYKDYDVEIRYDVECTWSDGEIGGYCTEFYKDGIEIGNIVNPLGTCIDVGFGLERLEMVLTGNGRSKEETIRETVIKIIDSGFSPSYSKQGYLLRKLLRICYLDGILIDHPFYEEEIKRQEKIISKYNKLKEKHKDKSKEWWWGTFGIDIDLIN